MRGRGIEPDGAPFQVFITTMSPFPPGSVRYPRRMMKVTHLTIATWVLAGLLSVTVLLLAFAPFSEGINGNDGSRFQSTLFQHSDIPGVTGQFVNDVFYPLGGTGAMDLDRTILIRGFINAAFYLIGTMALLVAAQHLSLRYGLPIATSFFALFTYLTIVGIRGVVEGWFKLPGWSLLAAGTLFSSGFLWLKLVELLRNKSWGQHRDSEKWGNSSAIKQI